MKKEFCILPFKKNIFSSCRQIKKNVFTVKNGEEKTRVLSIYSHLSIFKGLESNKTNFKNLKSEVQGFKKVKRHYSIAYNLRNLKMLQVSRSVQFPDIHKLTVLTMLLYHSKISSSYPRGYPRQN